MNQKGSSSKGKKKVQLSIDTSFDENQYGTREVAYLKDNSSEDQSKSIEGQQSNAKKILSKMIQKQSFAKYQSMYNQDDNNHVLEYSPDDQIQLIDAMNNKIISSHIPKISYVRSPKILLNNSYPKKQSKSNLQAMLNEIKTINKNFSKNTDKLERKDITRIKKSSSYMDFKELKKEIQQAKKIINHIKIQKNNLKNMSYRNSQSNNINKYSNQPQRYNYITYNHPQYIKPTYITKNISPQKYTSRVYQYQSISSNRYNQYDNYQSQYNIGYKPM